MLLLKMVENIVILEHKDRDCYKLINSALTLRVSSTSQMIIGSNCTCLSSLVLNLDLGLTIALTSVKIAQTKESTCKNTTYDKQ